MKQAYQTENLYCICRRLCPVFLLLPWKWFLQYTQRWSHSSEWGPWRNNPIQPSQKAGRRSASAILSEDWHFCRCFLSGLQVHIDSFGNEQDHTPSWLESRDRLWFCSFQGYICIQGTDACTCRGSICNICCKFCLWHSRGKAGRFDLHRGLCGHKQRKYTCYVLHHHRSFSKAEIVDARQTFCKYKQYFRRR